MSDEERATICVVMSTFNGEKFVKHQIDSILSQSNVNVDLYIRDDGSTDNTVNILEEIAVSNINIRLIKGENIGYAGSFLSMLKAVHDYEYYAFADQDDEWLPNKLEQAVCKINSIGDPNTSIICYWCNLRMVNENLSVIGDMRPPKESDFCKGRYLIDKYGYGCTMVFSSALKELAVRNLPNMNISHDNWVGLTGVFLGTPVFDERSFIKYRQHQNNVVGGSNGFLNTWRRRVKNFSKAENLSRAIVASELLRCYSDRISNHDMGLLAMVCNYRKNLRNKLIFFFDKRTTRASFEKNLVFRIEILLSLA